MEVLGAPQSRHWRRREAVRVAIWHNRLRRAQGLEGTMYFQVQRW
jgi:hypothetical protein